MVNIEKASERVVEILSKIIVCSLKTSLVKNVIRSQAIRKSLLQSKIPIFDNSSLPNTLTHSISFKSHRE